VKLSVFFAILNESLKFAYQNIRANLLRTLLSLLGVTIGVFCIISILTLVDSIEYNFKKSVSKFGSDVIYMQKWPLIFESEYPWWKYVNRPDVTYNEMQLLQKRFTEAEAISYTVWIRGKKLSFEDNAAEGISVRGITQDYDKIIALNFAEGRYFTESESQRGENVAFLGYDLATQLFDNPQKAIGKQISALQGKLRIIGVLQKEGNSFNIGGSTDNQCFVPFSYIRPFGDYESGQYNPTILIKAPENKTVDELEDDLRGTMRTVRRLSPRQEDNFALNKITLFLNVISGVFDKINLYGWVIAGFSILVGGFGIANIMFVSVKERTSIIGIQKALGARRVFILAQFLGEAVLLCLIGGAIGLLLIAGIASLLNLVMPIKIILTLKNMLTGLGISSLIGILSGYIPSRQAARMDPIEAIRFSM
jgi:putative ABC transport system permease protein